MEMSSHGRWLVQLNLFHSTLCGRLQYIYGASERLRSCRFVSPVSGEQIFTRNVADPICASSCIRSLA